jgi:hypothetical protein
MSFRRKGKNMDSIFRNRKTVMAICFLSCAGILVLGVSAGRLRRLSRSQLIPPRVTNKTTSVGVSNVRLLEDGALEIGLLNQSTKSIYAYMIVTSSRGLKKTFTTFATAIPVAPGETKAERIPAANLDSPSDTNPQTGREVVFSAVYLEGGTVEGDSNDSEMLGQTMRAMKEQAGLAVKILRDAAASRESNAGQLLEKIQSQVASMPVKNESEPLSKERERGKSMINDRLSRAINDLRRTKAAFDFEVLKGQLAALTPYYERLAEKL